jgi:hypothetical protein
LGKEPDDSTLYASFDAVASALTALLLQPEKQSGLQLLCLQKVLLSSLAAA